MSDPNAVRLSSRAGEVEKKRVCRENITNFNFREGLN